MPVHIPLSTLSFQKDVSKLDEGESDSDNGNIIENGVIHQASITPTTNHSATHPSSQNSALGDEDIPLSDVDSLSSVEKAEILPHQRLTINNTAALLRAHRSIGASTSIPFSEHQSLVSPTSVVIHNVNDDLTRELAFYKQCLESASEARALLKKEGVPFSRPKDYFAEMVKSDEHMGKIKQRMTDEAANKKAATEARRQRDLKKFGKQVQIAKLQERDKAKRDMLGKIEILKRSKYTLCAFRAYGAEASVDSISERKSADAGSVEEEDMFDVALEDASKEDPALRVAGLGGRGPPNKRRKRDEKYGFGGKKRFAKSGDAISSGDLRGFSTRKMKGQKKPQRPGKSRRAKL